MANKLRERFKTAWNLFIGNSKSDEIDESSLYYNKPYEILEDIGPNYSYRPDRSRLSIRTEKTIVSSIYNRISMDAASYRIEHVLLDDKGRYLDTIDDSLNDCLTIEANRDQTSRAFIQDVVLSILDEGCVAVVPVDTETDIYENDGFDIYTMRVGKIVSWYPAAVSVELYDENSGTKKIITVPKSETCIIENPFYSIMNEPNSTLQRLKSKLSILDVIDEQSGSGKLDLIVQLPYVVKGETRKKQAEDRRKDIERQLNNSKFGVAYTDGTEKITQLNRPIENNLMEQVKFLTTMFYTQLGINEEVISGSANEQTMTNYYVRVVEPLLLAITDEMKRKFLSKDSRKNKESIMYFKDPFRLTTVNNVADLADKMTRNEVMSTNEVRQVLGMKPSDSPNADELRNKNMPVSDQPTYNQNEVANLGNEADAVDTGIDSIAER